MASGTGQVLIDFGAFPGSNEASIAVTGISTISNTAKVEAWVMADDTTSDHTADDHKYFPVFVSLTCGSPVANTGFTIYGRSTEYMQGTWIVRYVWAD